MIRRLVVCLSAASACALLTWVLVPKPDLYESTSFSTLVTDRQGRPLRLVPAKDERYRLFTPLDEIAPAVIDATLQYEDRRFREHPGVDPFALLRAAWTTYVRGSRVVGGSTLTMQLARMRFDLDTRSVPGKLAQMLRALQLERHYDKREILEAYLNLAPYGGSIEGVGTAARIYFDKPAGALNRGEAMSLAVIPQSPAARFPATADGRSNLRAARDRLAAAWLSSRPEGDHGESVTRALLDPEFRSPGDLPRHAPHFVRDHVALDGAAAIRTTLDLDLQRLLESRIRDHVDRRGRDGIRNATALLIDHRSMEVLALVGSRDFFDASIAGQVNGVRARRSPGSTLKPLLFGLALDHGLIHPMTLLEDAPRRYAAYTPENFDRGFLGPVFARDALIHSRNVPAVGLLAGFGVARFRDWLDHAGVEALRPPEEYGLSLVLGGNEVTMEELVRLYAMLARGGFAGSLVTVTDAESPAGSPRTDFVPQDRLLGAEASFLVLDMLRDVPRPDAPSLAPARRNAIAWKTGTSFGFRDAWTIGVVGPYVLAVWVGNFDGQANPALVGREAAAPLFFAIADSLRPSSVDRDRAPPPGLNLRQVEVCATTGDLPGNHCPRTTLSWFIPGTSPIKVSKVYRALPIDPATGLRSCRPGADTRQVVFEFWPSNLRTVFRRAGIAIRRPPPWSPECELDRTAASGFAPRIQSPQRTLIYHAPRRGEHARVLFAATTDDDARTLFWFVNDRFVGRAAPDEDYLWTPEPGHFRVRVVDDLGRADAVPITVAGAPTVYGT